MLTFGKTGFFALGSNSSVNNLGVSESVNNRLLNKNLFAHLTPLAVGFSGLGAGCIYAFDDFLAVTEGRDFFSLLLATLTAADLCTCRLAGRILLNCPFAIFVDVEQVAG